MTNRNSFYRYTSYICIFLNACVYFFILILDYNYYDPNNKVLLDIFTIFTILTLYLSTIQNIAFIGLMNKFMVAKKKLEEFKKNRSK